VRLPQAEYGTAMQVRAVHKHGWFSWCKNEIFLSEVLWNERIGLLPLDDRYYRVDFMSVPLARFDSRRMQIERLTPKDRDAET
jgi:hypothetical protein